MDIREIVARNIRHFRAKRNLTQARLAGIVGLSTGYLCDIEKSRKWPSAENLCLIAAALKLAPFQLFLPTEDSPWFDRQRVLSSFDRQIAEAFEKSRTEVFNRMIGDFRA